MFTCFLKNLGAKNTVNTVFFTPRKPKTTAFTVFFAPGSKNHGIYSVLWPAPSKNSGIYAVFSMLQEVLFPCQKHKNTVNYSVLAFETRWKTSENNQHVSKMELLFQETNKIRPNYSRCVAQASNLEADCTNGKEELPTKPSQGKTFLEGKKPCAKTRKLHKTEVRHGIFGALPSQALASPSQTGPNQSLPPPTPPRLASLRFAYTYTQPRPSAGFRNTYIYIPIFDGDSMWFQVIPNLLGLPDPHWWSKMAKVHSVQHLAG